MQLAKPNVRSGRIIRKGRGYSLEELKESGLDPRIARRDGVPVDVWRHTIHADNVEGLKSIMKTPRQSAKQKKE